MNIFKKHIEIVVAFIVFLAINIRNLLPYCRLFDNLNFDFQALLTWDYSASLGIIPHKQIFYPYGILVYFKNINIFVHILFFLITPILLTALFIIFKKIWRGRIYSYLYLILAYAFVIRHIGQDGFNRYGIFVVFLLIIGLILYSKKTLTKTIAFIFGTITGYIFLLMSDQGIYVFIGFTANIFLYPVIVGKELVKSKTKYYKSAFIQFAIYFVGVIAAIIPLFLYLFKKEAVSDFINFFIKLSDLALYAKTPFPPYSNTPENIFTFAVLIVTIFYLSFNLILKRKITLNNYLQINLCFLVIFLEQKSLIRSIDSVITFPSIILFILLLRDFKDRLQVNKDNIIYFVLIFVTAVLLFLPKNYKNIIKISYLGQNDLCIEMNLNKLIKNDSGYIQVKNLIKEKLSYEGKIFSYPSDPIFYLLFKQIPPYYFNNYDSSPNYAQNKQINYMKNNKVLYIIYNINNLSIQDGVPNYIRTSEEERYIFNNYKIINQVGNFLILERNGKVDLFTDNNLLKYGNLKKYLTEIDLKSIPRSEGRYKQTILQSGKARTIGEFKSILELNIFLNNNVIFSKNKFLILIPEKSDKNTSIVIYSIDGFKTIVSFNSCDRLEFCIINLSKIPLFYRSRQLAKIELISDFSGTTNIVENLSEIGLW